MSGALPGERGDVLTLPSLEAEERQDSINARLERMDMDDCAPADDLPATVLPLTPRAPGAPWWADRRNLVLLLEHLEDAGHLGSVAEAIYVVARPWKYEDCWREANGA